MKADKATAGATLGIIGGGQLALYLCQAARRLGVPTLVLTDAADTPAVHAADAIIVASLGDPLAVSDLIERSDVITYELEAVPSATLSALTSAASDGLTNVLPSPATLALIQNKATQKRWLAQHGLATAPFEHLTGDPAQDRAEVTEFGLPAVQKAEQGGYDGHGVQVLRRTEDLDKLWPTPSFIEQFISHSDELAVVVARGQDGTLTCYPPVKMAFDDDDNILTAVIAPADIDDTVAAAAIELARRAIALLDDVGVFAVELFIDPERNVLINEISPRVHNAGHLTMEASPASQFEMHVRAVMGLPLPEASFHSAATMLNLLCDEDLAELVGSDVVDLSAGSAHVHWYGKKTAKAKRKMGHLTATGASSRDASDRAQQARRALAALARPPAEDDNGGESA